MVEYVVIHLNNAERRSYLKLLSNEYGTCGVSWVWSPAEATRFICREVAEKWAAPWDEIQVIT